MVVQVIPVDAHIGPWYPLSVITTSVQSTIQRLSNRPPRRWVGSVLSGGIGAGRGLERHTCAGVRGRRPAHGQRRQYRNMDRFLSSAVNKIDAKGRVSVPAHFRAVVQKRGYQELYALKALDRPALDVGGLDLLDRYEQRIAMEDPFLQTADDMSFFVHGDSDFLKLDQDGRITVTDFVRSHTGITSEVAFVGRGTFFQMWEPSKLQDYSAQVRERLLKLRQVGMPGVSGGGAE
jgi:MraZ protein